jgi:release factor glutamine methyltransferase
MNANLPPKTLRLDEWLSQATIQLEKAGIASARLDAEIILAHTLLKNRTYLHAHNDTTLDPHRREVADARLQLRCERTPIAYIVGHKEFYGRLFRVTPATLIPRPESEDILSILHDIIPQNTAHTLRLIDVGTGSGCLGITAKLEFPQLNVTLLDISQHALTIARKNAEKLNADVMLLRSDLLEEYQEHADIIVANLPYVDPQWQRSPETSHEPAMALFAKDKGLYLIKKLLTQTPSHISSKGYLVLEADTRQHQDIIAIAKDYGLSCISTIGLIICLLKD